jgi:hypothetical protein
MFLLAYGFDDYWFLQTIGFVLFLVSLFIIIAKEVNYCTNYYWGHNRHVHVYISLL